MYRVIYKGIDFFEIKYEGYDEEEAYDFYDDACFVAGPTDEVILVLNNEIVEFWDFEDFAIFDDDDEFDDEFEDMDEF